MTLQLDLILEHAQPALDLPLPDMPAGRCQWSARCRQLAAGTVDTTKPGAVEDTHLPTCSECAERYSLELNLWIEGL
jgi:hypothetical protein